MVHGSANEALKALRLAIESIKKDDAIVTSPEASVKKPQPLVTGTPNPGYKGCDCATCKELDVDCEHCPVCSKEDSEKQMAMYDSSIGKAYEDCGCNSCKALDLKCEDCKSCSESMKSYTSDDEELDKWDNIEKACWVGYTQRGMKPGRNGGMVPNCVPVGKSDAAEIEETEEQIEKVSSARLKELVETYNKNKEGDKRITVGTLEAVYRRGIGAYRTNPGSVRPNVSSPQQWAMARVNAFMAGLRGKFPSKSFDLDLFPKGHPRSTKKSLFEDFANDVQPAEKISKIFSDLEKTDLNKKEGWGGSIFDLNPFKK